VIEDDVEELIGEEGEAVDLTKERGKDERRDQLEALVDRQKSYSSHSRWLVPSLSRLDCKPDRRV